MSDSLGIVYYSACRISSHFAEAVRESLREVLAAYAALGHEMPPIVSVTHRPVDLGRNICVGEVPLPGAWQVYMNALIGAKALDTEFVACAEDDTLYTAPHFAHRPQPDVFEYDRNRWVITRRLSDDGKRRVAFFYWRERTQFAQLVARRTLLVETLEERFAKFPTPIQDRDLFPLGWGEPGRYERNLGLPRRARAYFDAADPTVTFNHAASIRGRRRVNPDDLVRDDLHPWGGADDLWARICGSHG